MSSARNRCVPLETLLEVGVVLLQFLVTVPAILVGHSGGGGQWVRLIVHLRSREKKCVRTPIETKSNLLIRAHKERSLKPTLDLYMSRWCRVVHFLYSFLLRFSRSSLALAFAASASNYQNN